MIQKTYHVRTCLLGIMLPKKTKQNSSPLMFPVPPILGHQHMDYEGIIFNNYYPR